MDKNFDVWNEQKKVIEKQGIKPCIEGEIWWCTVGCNIGTEQNGKGRIFLRPVLVIKKINAYTIWVLPLSNSIKENHYRLNLSSLRSQIILSQIRTISTKRLVRKILRLAREDLRVVLQRIKILLDF